MPSAARGTTLTFAGRTRCSDFDVRILSRIFKRPGEQTAERPGYAPAADTNEKILSLAAEITGEPADLKTITGDKKTAGQKADTFDPAAYQRAKRLAKRPPVGGKPARFDPQLPLS